MITMNMLQNEDYNDYKERLFKYKHDYPDEITWKDIANSLNYANGSCSSPDKYRKEYKRHYTFDDDYDEYSEYNIDLSERLDAKLIELRKEKTIISDLRSDANRQLRRIDREDSLKEIAKMFADKMSANSKNYIFNESHLFNKISKSEALLLLGDWHYGLEVNEYLNKYNTEICKERLNTVLNKTIELCKFNSINHIHIFNLSDLISGRIHSQLRMQSRIDAVTQTMEVSELLFNFIYELSQHFDIDYYDCSDNHSRIEPNKKESLQLENFTRIIHWYLKNRFENTNVTVHENKSDDIILAHICGHRIVGIHGDKDNPQTVVNKLSSFMSKRPDLIAMGHRHHFEASEKNNCLVIMNSSLIGADQYALNLRENSAPAQTLIIVDDESPAHAIYRMMA